MSPENLNPSTPNKNERLNDESLNYHAGRRGGLATPGKWQINPTKPIANQYDLSLAYSPGVAKPCLEIAKNEDLIYDYTNKGNVVAVISNGTAVLGLGNIGAAAAKPVMEGKSVLFKRFAGIDSIDIEVKTQDPEEFINVVKNIGTAFGGINLEDIKSPDCFIIEPRLQELLDIPVFHDDQHGTAIITTAGILNAAEITGRKLSELKVVFCGAGAAAIACIKMLRLIGITHIIACDQHGVIYPGRPIDMNQWKDEIAYPTTARNLIESLKGADVFIGLSVKGALPVEALYGMNKDPIIFAMANPDPELEPAQIIAARPDAIIATGRSDYSNQVNNLLGFPYIFRGALDVRASKINDAMKLAAAQALAALAKEPVASEVAAAYGGRQFNYGRDYIIPTPFDPRLITVVPLAVAKAAVESGVAKKGNINYSSYSKQLYSRLSPTYSILNLKYNKLIDNPKRVIFAEGEEEVMIRAAVQWRDNSYGTPILVGKYDLIKDHSQSLGIKNLDGIIIENAAVSKKNSQYIDDMYLKLQRQGFLYRSCTRAVKTDRNIFSACMLAAQDGDILVSGLTRNYLETINEIKKIIPPEIDGEGNELLFGFSIVVSQIGTLFVADTAINENMDANKYAKLAIKTAQKAKEMGHEPVVAFISHASFGVDSGRTTQEMRKAIHILNQMQVDFTYDGEVSVEACLNQNLLETYSFSRLKKNANVLIMPTLHSASIAVSLVKELGNCQVIGPVLIGMSQPVQVAKMTDSVSDILNLAALALE